MLHMQPLFMASSSQDSSLYQQPLPSFGTCHSTSFLACFDRKTKHQCLGGIGIINPCKMTDHQFDISTQVTYPLTTGILQQIHEYSLETICEQQQIRKEIKRFY